MDSKTRPVTALSVTACVALAVLAATPVAIAQGRGGRGAAPAGPPPTPQASAPIDLTGYWVSVVTEDWRYRMVTPTKGDYQSVPMTPEAATVADGWDPAADEAAGNQCKSYGAAAIMRVPGRIRLSWDDDATLRLETDAGSQIRLFRFNAAQEAPGPRTWQGHSVAQWDVPRAGRGRAAGPAPGAPTGGSLKVVTTNLRAGYLRKNGVPYGEQTTVTEYFNLVRHRNGDVWLVVTSVVEDPQYLRQPFIVSSQFRKQADASGWDPTPCSSTW